MAGTPSPQAVTLGELAALAKRAAEARQAERAALDERAVAIVAAVRAGARLHEVGEAAGMTKAAASVIARRTLGPRTGSGGPYRRRRGAGAALEGVAEAALRARKKSAEARRAVLERDRAVLAGADTALSVSAMAEAMSMRPPVVHELIRRRKRKANEGPSGTLAS